MKRLEDVIDCIKYGSVLIIKQKESEKDNYEGTLIRQDGKIFDDVFSVEIGKFLNLLPNIKQQISKGYTYHTIYNYEQDNYQSTIMNMTINDKYTTITSDQIIDNFQVTSNSVLDSMIELDTKIAEEKARKKSLKYLLKTKVLKVVS